MKKFSVSLIILLWLAKSLSAQPLDSLLKIAERENLSLLSRMALVRAATEKVAQEGVLENPTVSFSAGRDMALVSARQMLPWWGTFNAMKNVAHAEVVLTEREVKMVKNEIFFEIKKAYFELAKLLQDIAWVRANIDLLKKLESLAMVQYQVNKTSMSELLRLQMQIRQEETTLQTMQAMQVPLTYRLNQLLNRPLEKAVEIDTVFFLSPVVEEGLSWENNPVFAVKEGEKKLLVEQQKLVGYERKPQWMLGLDYGYINLSMLLSDHNGSENMRFLMPMVGVSLPIYSRKKNDARLNELKWKTEAIEKEVLQWQNQLSVELANVHWKKQDAQRRIELYEFQFQQTERLISLQLNEYSTGKQNFSEVWQLSLMQHTYRLERNKAIFDYKMAIAEMEKIRGNH